jgi:hypothetical protein
MTPLEIYRDWIFTNNTKNLYIRTNVSLITFSRIFPHVYVSSKIGNLEFKLKMDEARINFDNLYFYDKCLGFLKLPLKDITSIGTELNSLDDYESKV